MRIYFITGTDTNIGKTYVTVKLLKKFNQQGFKTIALKPVATGCIDGYNEDALLLQKHSSVKLDYHLVNPFAFTPAISPNIASNNLSIEKIWQALQEPLKTKADICIIEGIGGWFAPINDTETMADLITKFGNIEIILVIGIRLGCLNHALLSYKAIKSISGWIANIIDPNMEAIDKNIETLRTHIKEPCLEIFNYDSN